ncbi:MAG TPA: Asp-tRNA(Asn)/Glu-tRNA(Gln) amidotransferase subunit GatC [Nitrososphaerales archaeon]|nr:Asp-tRNA(Asn)/Glu-tRNA(Gln) amidotransferase subunit GatC [Nitrososphaerales archaeon]
MSRKSKTKSVASVDLARVQRLADLARLSLGPQEAERLKGELSSILDYFATLDKADVSGNPAAYEGQQGGVRQDVVGPSAPDEMLEGVPQRKGRYVRAPRVF